LRIGLIIYGRLDFPSGGFIYDKLLVESLRQQGHHVEIFSLAWNSYPELLLQNYAKGLIKKIEAADLDILLQDELVHPSLFQINKRIKQELGIKIISIVHHLRISEKHSPLLKKLYRAIEQNYLNSVDATIVNSETTLSMILPMLKQKIPIVIAQPGGDRLNSKVEKSEIKERGYQKGALKILFLGAIISRKAPHLILEALSNLQGADLVVRIAGDQKAEPRYYQSLVELTKKLGLGRSVEFLGHVNLAALSKVMADSHVLILPSSYEGYGIVYAEGMAFGLPAIGRNVGAAPELIKHGVNGFLLSSEDGRELAKHIAMLAKDRDKLYQMSLAARARFEELPTWAESMLKIENFLTGLKPKARSK
jgi:glycosyltransferase involved in cell wall biosynthesis